MGLLRFFLAFSVVNVHGNLLGMNLVFADVAVQSFYVISGFYMAMVLTEKYNHPGVTYRDFLLSRILRIVPAYLLVLFMTAGLAAILWLWLDVSLPPLRHWLDISSQLSVSALSLVSLPQFILLGIDFTNYFTVNPGGEAIFTAHFSQETINLWRMLAVPQAWTLSIEFYFYMLAPFLVRKSIPVIIGLIILSFLVRLLLLLQFDLRFDPWSYRFFPSELLFFLCGSLAYRISCDNALIKQHAYGILAICFLLIVVAGMMGRYGSHGKYYDISPVFIGLVFLMIPGIFSLTKNNRIDRYIGELSYPLYISHMLVIWGIDLIFVRGSMQQKIVAGLVSVLFAVLIYELVDRQVDAYRHRKFAKKAQHE